VSALKEQLAAAQAQAAGKAPAIGFGGGPMAEVTVVGPTERALIDAYLTSANNLVSIVPRQTTEEFLAALSKPPMAGPNAAAQLASKQACLNSLLALSSLLQLPLMINNKDPQVAGDLAYLGRPLQMVKSASAPYFERAKNNIKECFHYPCQDVTSALLGLSTSSQIMADTTSGYLYSNMALSMCELAKDISEEVRASCAFLKRIRGSGQVWLRQRGPPQPVAGMSDHTRFLEIVAFMMVCLRSQHCVQGKAWPHFSADEMEKYKAIFAEKASTDLPWPKEKASSVDLKVIAETGVIECGTSGTCPIGGALGILDEADALVIRAKLPPAARLWVLALRARILCIGGFFEAAVPICEELATIALNDASTMQDPFSLYACYSNTFALQNLEKCGGAFAGLWRLLRAMAMVWPLAATLLGYVSKPSKSYAVCADASSCVGKVESAVLQGTLPEGPCGGQMPGAELSGANRGCPGGEAGESREPQVLAAEEVPEEAELRHKSPHQHASTTLLDSTGEEADDLDFLGWGEIDMSIDASGGEKVEPGIELRSEAPLMEGDNTSGSATTIEEGSGSASSMDPSQIEEARHRLSHTMEEYAPILSEAEESLINEAILGIADDDVDMESLLANIEMEIEVTNE